MHNVETYIRLPGLVLTLKDLKTALRERLARLRPSRITVRPVSEEWCRRHQRESVKH